MTDNATYLHGPIHISKKRHFLSFCCCPAALQGAWKKNKKRKITPVDGGEGGRGVPFMGSMGWPLDQQVTPAQSMGFALPSSPSQHRFLPQLQQWLPGPCLCKSNGSQKDAHQKNACDALIIKTGI